MICALVRTDGRRDYIESAIQSLEEMVTGPITRRIIHDDSGDPNYAGWLAATFPGWQIHSTGSRSGFAGAIQSAWRLLEDVESYYVFDVEDDFIYNEPVDLDALVELLRMRPYLAQIALKRQPWGTEPPGGFMAQAPSWYVQWPGWVETRRNWTTNPSVYRRDLVYLGWPDAPDSEGYFGFALKEDFGLPWGIEAGDVQFGIWGRIDDPPAIDHIGEERIGVGY